MVQGDFSKRFSWTLLNDGGLPLQAFARKYVVSKIHGIMLDFDIFFLTRTMDCEIIVTLKFVN